MVFGGMSRKIASYVCILLCLCSFLLLEQILNCTRDVLTRTSDQGEHQVNPSKSQRALGLLIQDTHTHWSATISGLLNHSHFDSPEEDLTIESYEIIIVGERVKSIFYPFCLL
jgi:hypothetical protein